MFAAYLLQSKVISLFNRDSTNIPLCNVSIVFEGSIQNEGAVRF